MLLEDAPDAYREYLRERGISYLTCGRQTLDCRLLKEKLYAHFGVRTMLVCGGGAINWSFLEQHELDELSLSLAPAADGDPSSPAVFQRSAFSRTESPAGFRLKEINKVGQDLIHLIYQVNDR